MPRGREGARHLTRTCAHVLTHTHTAQCPHTCARRMHPHMCTRIHKHTCTRICAHTEHTAQCTHTCAPTNPYTDTPMPARSRGQQAELRRDRRRGRQLSYSGDNSPSPAATAKHPGPQSRRVCETWGHTRTVVNGLMEVETPDAWGTCCIGARVLATFPAPPPSSPGPLCGRKSPAGNCWPL